MIDDEREPMLLEVQEIHRRLLEDSRQWVRELPTDTHIAKFARPRPDRSPRLH